MSKTTLYLPDHLMLELKRLVAESKRETLTSCITQAVQEFLFKRKKKPVKKSSVLLKYAGSSKMSQFGDAVEYQRKLRSEWES